MVGIEAAFAEIHTNLSVFQVAGHPSQVRNGMNEHEHKCTVHGPPPVVSIVFLYASVVLAS